MTRPLTLSRDDFRLLLEKLGPSLALWRAAEIAVLRQALPAPHRPLLDLGCGDGLVTAMVLPRVDVGLDPNRQALEQARSLRLYEELQPAAVQDASLPAGGVATIISNSVLEHIPDLPAALQAVSRLLQPGGAFLFTAPTAAFSRRLALPLASYARWRNRSLLHLNLWTLPRWEQALAQVGLRLVEAASYMPPALIRLWDLLELLQQLWIGQQRLFSLFWRRLSPTTLDHLAQRLSRLDLSAAPPGGGRLIIAYKEGARG